MGTDTQGGDVFRRPLTDHQPVKDRPHNVYFGSLLLGQLDLTCDRSLRLAGN